jgi:hypothetical protein
MQRVRIAGFEKPAILGQEYLAPLPSRDEVGCLAGDQRVPLNGG